MAPTATDSDPSESASGRPLTRRERRELLGTAAVAPEAAESAAGTGDAALLSRRERRLLREQDEPDHRTNGEGAGSELALEPSHNGGAAASDAALDSTSSSRVFAPEPEPSLESGQNGANTSIGPGLEKGGDGRGIASRNGWRVRASVLESSRNGEGAGSVPALERSATAPAWQRAATLGRRIVRSLGVLVAVVLLVVVGLGVFALVRGSWMVTPVLSGSMRPGLSVGGVVVSERVPVKDLAVRDVIVFNVPGKSSEQVVHRIVRLRTAKSGQILINTQGDANRIRDPWTLTIKGNYAYLVRWSLPLLGYPAVWYQNNRGILLLLVGVLLVWAAASTVLKERKGRSDKAGTADTETLLGEPVAATTSRVPTELRTRQLFARRARSNRGERPRPHEAAEAARSS